MTVQRDMKPKSTKTVVRATSCPDFAESDNQEVDGDVEESNDTSPSSVSTRSRYILPILGILEKHINLCGSTV